MKIKIIKKFLASLIVAAAMIGAMSGVVGANPYKHLIKSQNIYDPDGRGEPHSGNGGQENDQEEEEEEAAEEEEEEEEEEQEEPTRYEIIRFNSLLDDSWNEFDLEDFLKICMKISYNGLLAGDSLEKKLKTTNRLIKCSYDEENQKRIAKILRNFSYYNFFKKYTTEQKLYITDTLINLLSQDDSKPYAVEAFSSLCANNFFEKYSAVQKTKIAKALIGHIHQGEFDNNVMESLAEILNAPDVLKKLTQDEQDTYASIMEEIQIFD